MSSIRPSVLSLPDHLLAKVFRFCPSVADRVRFGAVCCRLRRFVFRWRQLFGHFESVCVECDGAIPYSIRITANDGAVIATVRQFLLDDNLPKARSAFVFLFDVCRPKQLKLTIKLPNLDRVLDGFVDVLPAKEMVESVEQLFLTVCDCEPRRPGNTRLFDWLPTSALTHLNLDLSYPTNARTPVVRRILSDWLRNCPNLQMVLFEFDYDPNYTDRVVVKAFERMPRLRAISLKRPLSLEVLNRNSAAVISHLCFARLGEELDVFCSKLCFRSKLNITSICCLDSYIAEMFDISLLIRNFPKCRRMEFKGQLAYRELRAMCVAYQPAETSIKEEAQNRLQVVMHVDGMEHEPRFERIYWVDVSRVLFDETGRHCAVRREFE